MPKLKTKSGVKNASKLLVQVKLFQQKPVKARYDKAYTKQIRNKRGTSLSKPDSRIVKNSCPIHEKKIMTRVTSGSSSHSRHKKIIKSAKGYFGRRKNTFRAANQAVEKAGQYSYGDRKKKRNSVIMDTRINAALD